MDSVSAEVNGLLTASVAVDNLYVGGGFGGGTLPDPITVTFGENAALNAENTSSSGGINIDVYKRQVMFPSSGLRGKCDEN